MKLREIHQPEQGYRYNIDSFLLARFAHFKTTDEVCDLGSGVGILGLLALDRGGAREVKGIEVQEELVTFARRNIQEWNLGKRMEVICDNWKNWKNHFQPHIFDLVISNPPYRKEKTGKRSQNISQAIAKHEILGKLRDLIQTASALMKREGRFCFIYPVLRLEEVIQELHLQKLKIGRIAFVHPFTNQPATQLIIEARRSVAGEIRIEPPLVVYRAPDCYTSEVEKWVGKKTEINR